MSVFIESVEKLNDENGKINQIECAISGDAYKRSDGKAILDLSVIVKNKEDVSQVWCLWKSSNEIIVSASGLTFNVLIDNLTIEFLGSLFRIHAYATGDWGGMEK